MVDHFLELLNCRNFPSPTFFSPVTWMGAKRTSSERSRFCLLDADKQRPTNKKPCQSKAWEKPRSTLFLFCLFERDANQFKNGSSAATELSCIQTTWSCRVDFGHVQTFAKRREMQWLLWHLKTMTSVHFYHHLSNRKKHTSKLIWPINRIQHCCSTCYLGNLKNMI